jgi:alcohol dehydrogenase class IV
MIKKAMMVKRIYNNPEVYYGKGATGMVLKAIDAENVLVLVSPTVQQSEYYGKILGALDDRQVREEPVSTPEQATVLDLVQKYTADWWPSVIVAIGGGKVLDVAKVMRVLMINPGVTFEDLEKNRFCENSEIKFVAVPTTPGTGSETNSIAVLRTPEGTKIPYINSGFVPDIAILDHEFLMGHDLQALMEFAADIFAHAFEGSVSPASSTLLGAIAKSSMSLLGSALDRLKEDPKDPKALGDLLYAGHLAGIVQGNAFVGACHALAHAIEPQVHVSHGMAILLTLKQTLLWLKETTQKQDYDEFITAYDAMGFDAFRKAEILAGIDPDNWADAALADPSISTSPVRMKKDNILVLIDWILNRS